MPEKHFTPELHPQALGLWILTIHEVVVTTVAQGRNIFMAIPHLSCPGPASFN